MITETNYISLPKYIRKKARRVGVLGICSEVHKSEQSSALNMDAVVPIRTTLLGSSL